MNGPKPSGWLELASHQQTVAQRTRFGWPNPILKAVQGAGIGFANYALGGGTWWKAGLIGGTMRGASFYLERRIRRSKAVTFLVASA